MAIDTIKSSTLRETVHRTVLPSGLTVFFCPKVGFRKKYACYSTFYGSVDNRFRVPRRAETTSVPDGIAHFLEHTLFETEKGNVSDLFARNGAYNNAMTSFNTTTYLFASAERFYDNLHLLLNFVDNPVFDPAKVDKERGIIEQEILRYRDDPAWVGYMGLLESLFAEHPMRIDIAGTPESIAKIDSETLHDCYNTFYDPRNMILFVIGDLDRDAVFDFVAEHHSAPPGEDGERPWNIERLYPSEPDAVATERFEVAMEVAQPKLLLGYKETSVPRSGRKLLDRELTAAFALDMILGRSSDAFTKLYLDRLILDDFSASYDTCAGVGFVVIGGDTPDPARLQGELEDILGSVSDGGRGVEDFERQKRKFTGSFVRAFNSLEYIASNYTSYRFYGLDLFDVVDAVHAIRREDVDECLRAIVSPERRSVAVIRPKG